MNLKYLNLNKYNTGFGPEIFLNIEIILMTSHHSSLLEEGRK